MVGPRAQPLEVESAKQKKTNAIQRIWGVGGRGRPEAAQPLCQFLETWQEVYLG